MAVADEPADDLVVGCALFAAVAAVASLAHAPAVLHIDVYVGVDDVGVDDVGVVHVGVDDAEVECMVAGSETSDNKRVARIAAGNLVDFPSNRKLPLHDRIGSNRALQTSPALTLPAPSLHWPQ